MSTSIIMSTQASEVKGTMIPLTKLTHLQLVQLLASIGMKNVEAPLAQKNITGDDFNYVESIEDLKELEMDLLLCQFKRLLVKIQQWKREGIAESVLLSAAAQYKPPSDIPPVPPPVIEVVNVANQAPSAPQSEPVKPAVTVPKPKIVDNKPVPNKEVSSKSTTSSNSNSNNNKNNNNDKPSNQSERKNENNIQIAPKKQTSSREDVKEKTKEQRINAASQPKDMMVAAPKKPNSFSKPEQRGQLAHKQQSAKLLMSSDGSKSILVPSKLLDAVAIAPGKSDPRKERPQKQSAGSAFEVIKPKPQTIASNSGTTATVMVNKQSQSKDKVASMSAPNQAKPTAVIPNLSTKPPNGHKPVSSAATTTGASNNDTTAIRKPSKFTDAKTLFDTLHQMVNWPATKIEQELQLIFTACQHNVRIVEQLIELKTIELLLNYLTVFLAKASVTVNATTYSVSNILASLIGLISVIACNENYSKRDLNKGLQQLREYPSTDIFTLLISVLQQHLQHAQIVVAICHIIKSFQSHEESIRKIRKTNPYLYLVQALEIHKSSGHTCMMICWAIAVLSNEFEGNMAFLQLQILPIMTELLTLHFQHATVIEYCAHVLCSLTSCATSHKDESKLDTFKSDFGTLGGLKQLITLLQHYYSHKLILQHSVRLLTNLLFIESNMKLFGKENGCGVLIQVLEHNQQDATLVEELCLSIINASFLSENITNFHKQSTVCAILIQILQIHITQASLVEQVCQALTNLTTLASHQIVAIEAGGCYQLIEILHHYLPSKRSGVIEQCLRAITNIANRNDGQEQFGKCASVEIMIQLLQNPVNAPITRLAAKALANLTHHPDNKSKITLPSIHYILYAVEKFATQQAVAEECLILLAKVVVDFPDFIPSGDARWVFTTLLVKILERYVKQSLVVETLVIILDCACSNFDNVLCFLELQLTKWLIQVCKIYTAMQHPILIFHTIHALQNMSKYPMVLAEIAKEEHGGIKFLLAILKQYEDHLNIMEVTSKVLNLLLCSTLVEGQVLQQGIMETFGYNVIIALMKRYWNKAIVFREVSSIVIHIIEHESKASKCKVIQDQEVDEVVVESQQQQQQQQQQQVMMEEDMKTTTEVDDVRTDFNLLLPSEASAAAVVVESSGISPLSIPSATPTVTATSSSPTPGLLMMNIDLVKLHETSLQSLKFYFKHSNPHLILNISKIVEYIYDRQQQREQQVENLNKSTSFPSLSSLLKGSNLSSTTSSKLSTSSLLSTSPHDKKASITFASYNTPDMTSLLLEIIQECYQMEDVVSMLCELLLLLTTYQAEEIPAWIGAIGGCKVLLDVTAFYKHDVTTMLKLLVLLQQLAQNSTNIQMMIQSKGLEIMGELMNAFQEQLVGLNKKSAIEEGELFEDQIDEMDEEAKVQMQESLQKVIEKLSNLLEMLQKHQTAHPNSDIFLPSFQRLESSPVVVDSKEDRVQEANTNKLDESASGDVQQMIADDNAARARKRRFSFFSQPDNNKSTSDIIENSSSISQFRDISTGNNMSNVEEEVMDVADPNAMDTTD